MAWREKLAWLSLVSMVAAYGTYFALILHAPRSTVASLALFGAITVAQAMVTIVASIALALGAVAEARAPADERDREIGRRGARIAYFVLLVGMILVGVVMPLNTSGMRIVNTALLALVIAEVTRQAVVVASYRRGWHG